MVSIPPSCLVALVPRERALFLGEYATRLRQLLPHAVYIDKKPSTDEWCALLRRVRPEILISGWSTPSLPANLHGLRYLCHVGGTVRQKVTRRLLETGVLVTNWGDSASETLAEATLMLTLSALRRSHYVSRVMHGERGWLSSPIGSQTLFDRKVRLHGFGRTARRLIPLLKPFRVDIAAFSPGVPSGDFARHGVRLCTSLHELFEEADVLIEIESLTSATRGIVSRAALERLPPGSTFVNVARGGLVDEAALAELAAAGRIRIALDVFENEPLPADSPLRGLADAVLFPHLGGLTDDRYHHCGKLAVENVSRYLRGEPMQAVVTPEIFDRST